MSEKIKTEKLIQNIDTIEVALSNWMIFYEKIMEIPDIVDLFIKNDKATLYDNFAIPDLETFLYFTRNDISRISACMEIAAYTLAGQLAMLYEGEERE